MNELIEDLQHKLNPLRVTVSIDYSDNVYYLTLNGKDTYHVPDDWDKMWPQGIAGFGKMFLSLEKVSIKEIMSHSPGIVKYKIGSLFDMLS